MYLKQIKCIATGMMEQNLRQAILGVGFDGDSDGDADPSPFDWVSNGLFGSAFEKD
jgi:hypothetical protein